jgi:hypothetical protein
LSSALEGGTHQLSGFRLVLLASKRSLSAVSNESIFQPFSEVLVSKG